MSQQAFASPVRTAPFFPRRRWRSFLFTSTVLLKSGYSFLYKGRSTVIKAAPQQFMPQEPEDMTMSTLATLIEVYGKRFNTMVWACQQILINFFLARICVCCQQRTGICRRTVLCPSAGCLGNAVSQAFDCQRPRQHGGLWPTPCLYELPQQARCRCLCTHSLLQVWGCLTLSLPPQLPRQKVLLVPPGSPGS